MTRAAFQALRTLARERGVMTSYQDAGGARRSSPPESLIAVLHALGEPVEKLADAPKALRERRKRAGGRLVEPTIVDWTGSRTAATMCPTVAARSPRRFECALTLESGEVRTWRQPAGPTLALPHDLPIGRHRLVIRGGGMEAESVVLTAPPRVGSARVTSGASRDLGVFLPLYALRSRRSWGAGDLTDLGGLARWAAAHGAPILGTLPMLAGYLDDPFDPSPYAPISRLLFSEFFLDPSRSPDLSLCPDAQALLQSASFNAELARLRDLPEVDHRAVMAAKRRVLEPLARAAYATPARRRELDRFARTHEHASIYAAFRAATERQRKLWRQWPERLRAGRLRPADYDAETARYYLYAQLLLHEQLGTLSEHMQAQRATLYLDLPVGVHAGGYDVWRFPHLFAEGMSVGAPPDPLAAHGQNWGFPPVRPDASRQDGHAYFAECIRAHLAHARLLRIDHVMALHRLFWIPEGMGGEDGVYVRYPAEEMYAALSIEAHRAASASGGGVRIVGENLGTVPEAVNKGLAKRRILRMFIAQFEFAPTRTAPMPEPEAECLAALNTHDTPTFAAFFTGEDIDLRVRLGLADERSAKKDHAMRRKLREAVARFAARAGHNPDAAADDPALALRLLLERLSASQAAVVLVNLEDLWLEKRPQNVPGVADDRTPNWRRKAAHTLEDLDRLPMVIETLRALATLRTTPTSLTAATPGTKAFAALTRPSGAGDDTPPTPREGGYQ